MGLQVLEGLQQLHSHNIVHGGLKPSNVLVDSELYDVVLSDYAVGTELSRLPNLPASRINVLYMYTLHHTCTYHQHDYALHS